MNRRTMILLPLVIVALVGLVPVAQARGVQAVLTGSAAFPAASGKATFDNRPLNEKFEAEIQHVPELAGATLTVSVDATVAGMLTVDALGFGRLELEQQRGQAVPPVHAGSLVEVATDDGTLVASGVFP